MTNEADFQVYFDADQKFEFLPGTTIEKIRDLPRGEFPRFAVFDFDGTLSLIREGWPEIMIPMMVRELQKTNSGESEAELTSIVNEFVMRLTGKQTIYQMIQLVEEIAKRGGSPKDPQDYKQQYHDALMAKIEARRDSLRRDPSSRVDHLVYASIELLESLKARGVTMYLASGTDERYVKEEARLLGLDPYFGQHIYGAQDNYLNFSKKQVIDRLIAENKIPGEALIGFGDGFVEIDNIREVGGIPIGVASNEQTRDGSVDLWKRRRLIHVGAAAIIPDYRHTHALLEWLWTR